VKVAIIGGTGEFGGLFARFFKDAGHEVVITGRNERKGTRAAGTFGVEFTSDNKEASSKADAVFVSVPIETTVEVIKEVAPFVREGCLLADFTSVKVEPCAAMQKHAGKGVEVVGMHPMFGPRIPSLEGQTVILTPVRSKKWLELLEGFLSKRGARVFISTPEEHDRTMGAVQVLTHFAYITGAAAIKELGVDVKQSRNFASPVYELMLDLIARIVGQNPHLYAAIQMHNPYTAEVHETFIREAERLKEAVREKDVETFTFIMAEAAKSIGDVDAAMGKSDKAIAALTEELKELKTSIGREVALRHIYSNAVHVGTLKEVNPEEVLIERPGRKTKLKLSNVELLDDAGTWVWKAENLPKKRRDFSVLVLEEADEKTIANIVKTSDRRITSCEVLDVYTGSGIPADRKSVTLRVEAVEFEAGDFERVVKLLKGIGGRLR